MSVARRLGTPQDDALRGAFDYSDRRKEYPFGTPVTVTNNYNARFGDLVIAFGTNNIRLPDTGRDGIGRVVTVVNGNGTTKVWAGEGRYIRAAASETISTTMDSTVYIQISEKDFIRVG